MDIDQEEMRFLGLFGIYREAYKLMFGWRNIFSQITLALILPLSIIFLAAEEVSTILYWRIRYTEYRMHRTEAGTPKYNGLSELVSSEWAMYILFKAVYLAFLLAVSLLSTAAIVYTIASIYTSREVTFKKVMSVVPRVWKRLMITFFCIFALFFVYNMVFVLIMFLWRICVVERDNTAEGDTIGTFVFVIILVLYAVGFVYMTIIWQQASVVTVLEDACGFKAMKKSKYLIKGKMLVVAFIFFKLNLLLLIVRFGFRVFFTYGCTRSRGETCIRGVGLGALSLLLLLTVFLFGLVVQTVIYFVCKSYHRENIDKAELSEHLDGIYLGEYVPLKEAMDVQMKDYCQATSAISNNAAWFRRCKAG